jgi:hypothetical protein
MYTSLFKALKVSDTVLTVNKRLALFLQSAYHDFKINTGHNVWQVPTILPLTRWLEQMWGYGQIAADCSFPLLLNSPQVEYLWQKIIRQSPQGDSLLRINTTAQLAQKAWALCQQWRVDIDAPLFAQSDDSYAFQQWAQAFRLLCDTNRWLDMQRLPDYLIEQLSTGKFSLPKRLFLIGFEEYSPQQQALFAARSTSSKYFIFFLLINNLNTFSC